MPFAAMMVLLQLVDSFTVMNGLRLSGMSLSKAQNLKEHMTGRNRSFNSEWRLRPAFPHRFCRRFQANWLKKGCRVQGNDKNYLADQHGDCFGSNGRNDFDHA